MPLLFQAADRNCITPLLTQVTKCRLSLTAPLKSVTISPATAPCDTRSDPMSLRWKLVLSIGIPVLVVYGVLIWMQDAYEIPITGFSNLYIIWLTNGKAEDRAEVFTVA